MIAGREHSPDGRESPTGDVKPALDNGSKDHVIRALKTRIHDLEELNREAKQKYRCLICLVRIHGLEFIYEQRSRLTLTNRAIGCCRCGRLGRLDVAPTDRFGFPFLDLHTGRLPSAGRVDFVLARALRRVLAPSSGKPRGVVLLSLPGSRGTLVELGRQEVVDCCVIV